VKQGGAIGAVKAGVGATSLAGKTGILGSSSTAAAIESGAADLSNLANIYTGLKQGGVLGYGGAAVNAAQLGSRTGAFGEASGTVGEIAGPLAAGLSVYNFAKNWQSGDTGGDALRGAEAGASIGSVIPGLGTIAGAVIGGAVGAASSLFGPGKEDPENANWDQYAAAYDKGGASAVQGATPSQNFQLLAGIFDARSSNLPFYQKYGRMGENRFMSDMTGKINQALAAGTISKTDSASAIYSKVVGPWINAMSPGGWQATSTKEGSAEKQAAQNMITGLIGQYQSGQITAKTPLGISGQTIGGLQSFGALGVKDTTATKAAVAQTMQPAQAAAMSMPGFGTSSSGDSSAMLAMMLAIPALSAGAAMADPNNPSAANPAANTGGSPGAVGTDPNAAGGGAGTTGDSSWLSSLGNSLTSFLSSPLGSTAEFATLGGIGLAQANSQKATNDAQAAKLAAAGAPYSAAGASELSQLTGGPSMGGPMGASITQQTDTAAELGNVAKTYGTGNLTPAQSSQVQDFIKQQRAMVDTQLAQSGNLDSSARQAAYQQIDDNAAQLSQSLTNQNLQTSAAALTAVQGTYSNLLNQALSSSEFGFSTESAAIQLQIQSDTQLAASLNALFAGIAQGFGNAIGGGKSPAAGGAGAGVAGAAGAIAKGVAGAAGGGVSESAAGGGTSAAFGGTNPTLWEGPSTSDQAGPGTFDPTQAGYFDPNATTDYSQQISDYAAGDPFSGGG
jgi:hypothetical protein